MFKKAILISALLYSFNGNAAELDHNKCSSSVIIEGMKIEFSITEPIILVNKNSSESVLEKTTADLKLTFTAFDKDIQWQENLYTLGIGFQHTVGNDWFRYRPRYVIPIVSKKMLEIHTLKKGTERIIHYPIHSIDFEKSFKQAGFNIAFGANGKLPDINRFSNIDEITNPYVGDKNIWQSPFDLCLKTTWQYK
ncbi:hypothetical protein N5853_04990 [Bartonella sp. HY329]|uniref:hypothetical protein n=1 Tax=unclassified Bartonella TaxID=2645622 RepID=UPI0021C7F793|nr:MULTISPECIES: hypothetical protein [unclassified Bartonella]UXM95980.1 hypothetical protein N5853_04990 [Bartonella sp. HY329]UXN10305.1 hypothetical protein N5852_05000 [Bartonella sp. HY328]